jgi:hypothetical protein
MPKSYRIRTQPGVDKSIQIKLDQDFEFLEILSLKILQSDIYTRLCSDYGVIVGRVLTNGGFGLPNAKVSIFIPISEEDQQDPIISELYPYTSLDDLNVDGYRYNLLPYKPSYTGHAATGTFPERDDVLTDHYLVEVYDKYYKFTTKTNESGDYMIFGVPTGEQTVIMDVDLSDIGCFSLTPQDLISLNLAGEGQFDGNKFKTSTNLRELPQLITLNKTISVQPLWGEPEVCLLGITRVDFDLTASANINIQPTSVFMGSVVSTSNEDSVKKNCKPKINTGNMCDLVAGPGQILAIRQTINVDSNGDPILEKFNLEQDGKVIDGDGTWLINVPMNLDYVTTNEFGEQILSNDPSVGIPTKGKYRFKVKWQNEQGLQNNFLRGNYLVPNVKEHGWTSPSTDPTSTNPSNYDFQFIPGVTASTLTIPQGGLVFSNSVNNEGNFTILINGIPYYGGIESIPLPNPVNTVEIQSNAIDVTQSQSVIFTYYSQGYFDVIRSYAFSLDWDDYFDKQSAIDCEDTFYQFNYNKIYTVSSFIDRYKNGKNRARHLGIKEITDRACQSENNKFPVNDAVRNFDFIQFVVSLFLNILTIPFIVLLSLSHIIALIWPILKWVLVFAIPLLLVYLSIQAISTAVGGYPAFGIMAVNIIYAVLYTLLSVAYVIFVVPALLKVKNFTRFALPMISYPDCDTCNCESKESSYDEVEADLESPPGDTNTSFLADTSISAMYLNDNDNKNPYYDDIDAAEQQTAQNDYLQLFSGVDQADLEARRGARSFLTKKEIGADEYGYPLTEPWSQKLNSFNLRDKYFNGINVIETSVNGSQPFKDQIVVALVDWGVQNQFVAGDMVSFQNPALSGDIDRITGITAGNQFNTFSITGTTTTGTTTIPIYYANTWTTNSSQNITITQNNGDGSYRFPADMEYYQVITGMTVQNFLSQSNTNANYKFPKEYLLHKIRYRYESNNGNNNYEWQKTALYEFQDYQKLGLVFFVRGVDPYTDKQTIQYNLSNIFGWTLGSAQITVTGDYRVNYPIRGYSVGKKPIEHTAIDNTPFINTLPGSQQRSIYGRSFTFVPDTTLMNSFPNSASLLPYYYLSTDSNNSGLSPVYKPQSSVPNLNSTIVSTTNQTLNMSVTECIMLPFRNISSSMSTVSAAANTATYVSSPYPYYVGGGSFLLTNSVPPYDMTSPCNGGNNYGDEKFWYLYSPSYRMYVGSGTINGVNFSNPLGIVMRSDRLPTSTTIEGSNGSPDTSFGFMQNNAFKYYKVPEEGYSEISATINFGSDVPSGNIDDSEVSSGLTSSLTCENMVSLECYTGYGTGFTVNPNCDQNGKVVGGCYYLLNKPYVGELGNDINLFLEWKARFNIMFAACRGVFGHMFQNNWINGVLYMPSFNKQTVFNILGQPEYNYCDDIIFYNDVNNSFFYRSSPWDGSEFIGAPRPVATSLLPVNSGPPQPDDSANSRQILFPTTILDMGNRDEFINEICNSDEFSGRYLGNTFMSTSYNDSSDILQLGIISRLVNATWGQQLFQLGSASINQYFSRSGDRIDGDIAQSFSINSEYQINPFISGNYPDNQIYIGEDSTGPVFGVFYDASGVIDNSQYRNRRSLSPGLNIYNFSPLLQSSFGYPNTQEVPLYKWKIQSSNSIFGNELNNWYTTADGNQTANGFYKQRYQSLDVIGDDYFKTPLMSTGFPNIYYGFITNFDSSGSPVISSPVVPNPVLVGGPNHFYFGLKNGKTALNRFIKVYIDTTEE